MSFFLVLLQCPPVRNCKICRMYANKASKVGSILEKVSLKGFCVYCTIFKEMQMVISTELK